MENPNTQFYLDSGFNHLYLWCKEMPKHIGKVMIWEMEVYLFFN